MSDCVTTVGSRIGLGRLGVGQNVKGCILSVEQFHFIKQHIDIQCPLWLSTCDGSLVFINSHYEIIALLSYFAGTLLLTQGKNNKGSEEPWGVCVHVLQALPESWEGTGRAEGAGDEQTPLLGQVQKDR